MFVSSRSNLHSTWLFSAWSRIRSPTAQFVGHCEEQRSETHSHGLTALSSSQHPVPLSVRYPCDHSHDADHERQSHAQHDAADGQPDGTLSRRLQTASGGDAFKQKGGGEVQMSLPFVILGLHLTPPPSAVVLLLQIQDQSGVAVRSFSQLMPVGEAWSAVSLISRYRFTVR